MRPLWRAAVLAFWVGDGVRRMADDAGGGWFILQAAASVQREEDVEAGDAGLAVGAATTAAAAAEAGAEAGAMEAAGDATAPAAAVAYASSGADFPRVRRVLPPGSYVVLTAYNPMGFLRADADNVAASTELRSGLAQLHPAPLAIISTLSAGFVTHCYVSPLNQPARVLTLI